MYAEPEFDTSTAETESPNRWRDEVASRINSYRARRRRKGDGDQSMRLDFEAEPAPAPSRAAIVAAVAEKYHSENGVADTNFYRRLNHETVESEALDSTAVMDQLSQAEPDESAIDPSIFNYEPNPEAAEAFDLYADPLPVATYDPDRDPDFDFNRPREVAEVAAAEVSARAARPEKTAPKLILFPKPSGMEPPAAPPVYDFAEPVLDRPRILDVPEDTMPTIQGPLFADIRLDEAKTDEAAEPKFPARIEIPLQVAAVNQRVVSGLIDSLIVAVASGIFGVIAWNVLPEIPRTREMAALAIAIPGALWFVYQYLFLVYAGRTTGMQMAHIRLCTFEGTQPTWEDRKYRALAMLLSCISVGLGFIWAMVDEDTLCWHDKISRTYPVQQR